jgi:sRNA-binding regulator protein Hfq
MTRPPKSSSGHGRGRSGRPAYGRRTPPPERTGLEAAFLGRIVETQATIKIQFSGGETIHGKVESFDRDTIAIRQKDGPTIVYRKSDIRFLEE